MKIVRILSCVVLCASLVSALPRCSFAAETATDELIAMVVEMLGNEDSNVRALALEQVRFYAPGEDATRRFAAELSKLSTDAKVGLLRALADRGDVTAREAVLARAKSSGTGPVEVAAVAALAKLGGASDGSLLVARLSFASKQMQAAARRGLIDLSGEGVSKAIADLMTRHAKPPVRVKLIYVLSDRRAIDAIPQLLTATSADDRSVRQAAMVALGWIAPPKSIPDMVPAVLAIKDKQERAAAEKAVMKVCSRIGNPDDRAKPLIAVMKTLGEDDRLALLSLTGRVGGGAALTEIEKAIASDDAKIHEMGLKALSNWPSASIAPRYIELVGSEEKPAHKLLALRALIRIAPLRDRRSHADRLELLEKAMALSTRDEERKLVLDRARAVRTVETLRFVTPFMDTPALAEQACLSVVELAHHRGLREPNKAEFHEALDKVIATSEDAVVVDRANRYKVDKTWVRPR